MNAVDRLYAQLLHSGLLVLRQAMDSRDDDWARAEVELLHNVPSLLGEDNPARHRYFWNQERSHYIDWVSAHGSEEAVSRMRTYYEPVWAQLEPLVDERFGLVTQT